MITWSKDCMHCHWCIIQKTQHNMNFFFKNQTCHWYMCPSAIRETNQSRKPSILSASYCNKLTIHSLMIKPNSLLYIISYKRFNKRCFKQMSILNHNLVLNNMLIIVCLLHEATQADRFFCVNMTLEILIHQRKYNFN